MRWLVGIGLSAGVITLVLWLLPIYQHHREVDTASGSTRWWYRWVWWPGTFAADSWESPIARRLAAIPGTVPTVIWRTASTVDYTGFGRPVVRGCGLPGPVLGIRQMEPVFTDWARRADDRAVLDLHALLVAGDRDAIQARLDGIVEDWVSAREVRTR
jgi:hypothetical protein